MSGQAVTGLAVAGAGALGCLARWLVGLALPTGRLPWATLAVNVAGSLAIGVVVAALATRGLADSRLRAALVVGVLGGFTTYSSFNFETTRLIEEGALATALLNVMLTLGGGFAAGVMGLLVARQLAGR